MKNEHQRTMEALLSSSQGTFCSERQLNFKSERQQGYRGSPMSQILAFSTRPGTRV